MTVVRYKNKKTGWVSVYESTSHYDPVNKKSKPIRKYIGYEDPVTGEFVPSSGRPGRKKKSEEVSSASEKQHSGSDDYRRALSEINRQRSEIDELKNQLAVLNKQLEDIHKAADKFITVIQKTQ